jgi:hypothetical protein
MPISITRHEMVREGVLSEQVGDAIVVANGAVSDALVSGHFRIVATGDCLVRFGEDPADASDGETWYAKSEGVRYLKAGHKVAVDALA